MGPYYDESLFHTYTKDEINEALNKLARETSGKTTPRLEILCFTPALATIKSYSVPCEKCGAPMTFQVEHIDNIPTYINHWDLLCKWLVEIGIHASMHEICPKCAQKLPLPRKVWAVPTLDNEEANPEDLDGYFPVEHKLPVTTASPDLLYNGEAHEGFIYLHIESSYSDAPYDLAFMRENEDNLDLVSLSITFLQGRDIFDFLRLSSPIEQYRSEALIAGICRFLNIPPSEEVLYRYLELTEKQRAHTKD